METFAKLKAAVTTLGKAEWRPMLAYVVRLHARSTHPPQPPFLYAWEEIGPGYCYGPAFGHWDLIHAVLDVLPDAPARARDQLLNGLAVQAPNGMLPGVVYMPRADDPTRQEPRWSHRITHPPVWPLAVEELLQVVDDAALLSQAFAALVRQIGWFEANRTAEPEGFYYTDILTSNWESGVDEGVRFDGVRPGPLACVDATSHLYFAYRIAEAWAERLGAPDGSGEGWDSASFGERAERLRDFIRQRLFCDATGFFHDSWAVDDPRHRLMALEGMWPLVVGAATEAQAMRVIDENLLNPARFFTTHPVSTVGASDPAFELRMWRGPTWNSMTYWAARGCLRYGRHDAASALLARALDRSAAQFDATGTIWEFYHPHGGDPMALQRKPHTAFNVPCRDYLGHNPLMAMARLYEVATRPPSAAGHRDQG